MSESSSPPDPGGESAQRVPEELGGSREGQPQPAPQREPGPSPEAQPLPTPPGSAQPTGRPILRASDAEREQTVERLRIAASEGRLTVDELEERLRSAYTVSTRNELEHLIADVSLVPLDATRSPSARAASGLTVREGPGGTRWIVSIMGGDDRRGRWRVGHHCNVINIMGGSDLDLCDAELASPVTQINVYSLMGGGTVRVPNGVEVQVSKFALMGGNDVRLGDELPPPGGPLIRVRLISVMGGSNVRRGRRRSKAERQRERELQRAQRDQLETGGAEGPMDRER